MTLIYTSVENFTDNGAEIILSCGCILWNLFIFEIQPDCKDMVGLSIEKFFGDTIFHLSM
jgi:hypothetical protein